MSKIAARIANYTSVDTDGLWLELDRGTDDDGPLEKTVGYPIEADEVEAIRDACDRWLNLGTMNSSMLQHIHESNLIEGYNSERADKESLVAWVWLLRQGELTHAVVCELQKLIVAHQKDLRPLWRGYYRDKTGTEVKVGGREGMPSAIVKAEMDVWLERYQEVSPKEAHILFEKIHPFADGNGRTGRMLMWYQEKRLGKEPTLITYKDRAKYYAWFED